MDQRLNRLSKELDLLDQELSILDNEQSNIFWSRTKNLEVFKKLETLAYRNIVVPLQGRTTFDFVNEHYNKGMKVLDLSLIHI